MITLLRRVLLLALLATPAWGQFELFLVNGTLAQPVPHSYDFGTVAPETSVSATFEITNVSSAPTILDLLTLTGTGFSVSSANAPSLPVSLAPQQSLQFIVVFEAAATGLFNATLTSVGIAVTFNATVPVELTCQWVNSAGVQPLSAGPVSFGTVPVGQSPTAEVVLLNQTSTTLNVPSVTVSGNGFSLAGPTPTGIIQPNASIAIEIQFIPTAASTFSGTLTIGGQPYALAGTGITPPLPQPSIAIILPLPESAQQGTVAVNLSAVSQIYGTGTVTLSFAPNASMPGAADPGIAFASGGQSATFTVFIGATQGTFNGASINGASTMAFQTGTTAGTLTVTVELGTNTVQQTIDILPAAVGVAAAQGVRSSSSIEVDLTGFDNTRTAGALSFTFYDVTGNQLGPAILANGGSDFAAYFQTSGGGTFELKAVFPVTGNTGTIAAFQASITNSAGTTTSARTNF